jgi:hypothetical protein
MSLAIHKYNSLSGPFGLCSEYWDEKASVFRKADETEQGDCCMRTCKPFVDECAELCPKVEAKYQKLCYKTCGDIQNSCKDFCSLSSPMSGVNNPIFKGTKEKGCGDGIYELLNKECIKKNKNDILNICRNSCIQSDKLDCEKHCHYSLNLISEEKANPLYFKKKVGAMAVKNTGGQVNIIQYIIYALVIVGIVFGIWILATL